MQRPGNYEIVLGTPTREIIFDLAGGTFEGRSAIHERLAREPDGFPDATYIVDSFVEEGDTFADEWTFVGTHTGTYELPDGTQLPPTGKRVRIKGMELVRVRDGKIVVDNLYFDNMTVAAQLGFVREGAIA